LLVRFGRRRGREPEPAGDDNKIFFVIGAGLSAIVLFLIAKVWQFLTIERGGD
jgi:hypothetical protein